jgi:hypothetical protein
MGFRPFRPALDFDAASGGRAMAGLLRNFRKPQARRGPATAAGNLQFPQFPQAIFQWPGVAGVRPEIARARIVATGNSFAPHRSREIDVRRGGAQCHPAMALREIIDASEHDAGPLPGGLG